MAEKKAHDPVLWKDIYFHYFFFTRNSIVKTEISKTVAEMVYESKAKHEQTFSVERNSMIVSFHAEWSIHSSLRWVVVYKVDTV